MLLLPTPNTNGFYLPPGGQPPIWCCLRGNAPIVLPPGGAPPIVLPPGALAADHVAARWEPHPCAAAREGIASPPMTPAPAGYQRYTRYTVWVARDRRWAYVYAPSKVTYAR